MAPLTIPAEYRPGLNIAAALSRLEVERIAVALQKGAPPASTRRLTKALVPALVDRSPAEANQLSTALFGLYALLATEETSPDKVAHDVALAFVGADDGEDIREGLNTAALEENLRSLLAIEPPRTRIKAVQLQYDHERTYCAAKIYTDIRPIFADDASQAPTQAVVTHMLKLAFHEGAAEPKEVFVMLDDSNLEELSRALDRARMKSATLQSILGSTSMTYVRGRGDTTDTRNG